MERRKKILLGVFAILCLFQFFFIVKRIHNYPFMIYDMYSRPEQKVMLSNHYLIITDGDTLNMASLPLFAEGRLRNNLSIYEHLKTFGKDYWDPALSSRQDRWTGSIFRKSRLKSRSDRLLRNSTAEAEQFPEWLKGHLQNWTGTEIVHLQVLRVTYVQGAGRITNPITLIDL